MATLVKHSLGLTEAEMYELCPVSASFMTVNGYGDDLYAQFCYPIENNEIRYYGLKSYEVNKIIHQSSRMYGLIADSLDILFNKHSDKLIKYYGSVFAREEFKNFFEYARYTYNNNHEALYGRFDIPYDYEKGEIKGFYEFNGNTPVMIHESVFVQDLMVTRIDKGSYQANLHFEYLTHFIKNMSREVGCVGVFADVAHIEDMLTAEYMHFAFHSVLGDKKVVIGHLTDLQYNECDNHQPFNAFGKHITHAFNLLPWEDMVEQSPEIFAKWQGWKDSIKFYEPAWRYFLSNKGVWAWIWDLCHSDEFAAEAEFREQYKDIIPKLLKTHLSSEQHGMSDFCRKPLNGRLSNNIEIHKDAALSLKTEGYYGFDETIDQQLCLSGSIAKDDPMAILGVWMAPDPSKSDPLEMQAVNISFREFDDEINNIDNEKYIPHLLVDNKSLGYSVIHIPQK